MYLKISSQPLRLIGESVAIAGTSVAVFFLSAFLFGQVFSAWKSDPPAFSQSPQRLFNNASTVYYQTGVSEEPAGSGYPVRIKIPAIAVDAAVVFVGLTADSVMDMPKSQDDAAWFNLGSVPGHVGSAVIAGHYGLKDKRPSAFDNLHKLRPGDKIYVEDDAGAKTAFVVTGARRYDPLQDATDVFGSSDGKSHLNLVTCEGIWDEKTQQYSKRLVVFTDRE